MIGDFQHHIDEGLVKKHVIDIDKAEALLNKSVRRLNYIKKQTIDDSTSNFVFEDIYECIREASQAIMALYGFKPYSHEALISFLKDFTSLPPHFTDNLNRLRILRNKSVYEAKYISSQRCREAKAFLDSFIPRIKDIFEKKTGDKP